jgi:hypothetical protein
MEETWRELRQLRPEIGIGAYRDGLIPQRWHAELAAARRDAVDPLPGYLNVSAYARGNRDCAV